MPTLNESLLVTAPIKRVYGFLADIERVGEWLPYVVEAHRTSEVATGAGAEIELVVNAAGRKSQGTTRCVSATPSQQLVFESSFALGLDSTVTFDLAAEGRQKTEMAVTVEYAFTGLGRIVGRFLGDSVARRDILAGLENLKARLEAEAARPTRTRKATTPAAERATKR